MRIQRFLWQAHRLPHFHVHMYSHHIVSTVLCLIREADLSGALVSADALHCQQDTVREILMSGGEALVQVKGNQKSVLSACEAIVEGCTPLFAQLP